jgi:hypothetical protein
MNIAPDQKSCLFFIKLLSPVLARRKNRLIDGARVSSICPPGAIPPARQTMRNGWYIVLRPIDYPYEP